MQEAKSDLFGNRGLIATMAQGWASTRKAHPRWKHIPGRPLSSTSYNHALAVLSSFYRYAIRHEFWEGVNPIDRVDRRPVEAYSHVQALDEQHVVKVIEAIGSERLKDYRDFALFVLIFGTGRRVAEIAQMTIGDVALKLVKTTGQSRQGLTVTFHTKGGKVLVDALDPEVALALDEYLTVLYGPMWLEQPAAFPIWINCSRDPNVAGKPLQPVGIDYLFKQHFGPTAHPHQARHSFAVTMDELRAPLGEIQRRLGHSSGGTTSRYLAQLRTEENPYAGGVVRRLGLRRRRLIEE